MGKVERVQWIDVGKGIGMLCVVAGHVSRSDTVIAWLASFHMPLFMFLSGLVSYCDCQYPKAKVVAKGKGLLKPYYIGAMFSALYYWIVERRFRNIGITLVQSIFGGGICYLPWMNNSPLWYLWCYFLVIVLFYLLLRVVKNIHIVLIIGIVLNICYWVFGLNKVMYSFPFEAPRVLDLFVYFSIGVLFKDAFLEYTNRNTDKKALPMIISLILVLISICMLRKGFDLIPGLNFSMALIGIIAITNVSLILNRNHVLRMIGNNTLFLLCSHVPIFRLVVGVLSIITKTDVDYFRRHILGVLVITIITVALSLLLMKLINYTLMLWKLRLTETGG